MCRRSCPSITPGASSCICLLAGFDLNCPRFAHLFVEKFEKEGAAIFRGGVGGMGSSAHSLSLAQLDDRLQQPGRYALESENSESHQCNAINANTPFFVQSAFGPKRRHFRVLSIGTNRFSRHALLGRRQRDRNAVASHAILKYCLAAVSFQHAGTKLLLPHRRCSFLIISLYTQAPPCHRPCIEATGVHRAHRRVRNSCGSEHAHGNSQSSSAYAGGDTVSPLRKLRRVSQQCTVSVCRGTRRC
jgi:hypothetical protein